MTIDLVLEGASAFATGVPRGVPVSIGIAGGRIAEIGAPGSIEGERVLPLSGRMVVPGFQDAHVHPPEGGLLATRCDLHGLGSAERYADAVAAYARTLPPDAWVLGAGWAMDAFPGGIADRETLDRAAGGRPAFLINRDAHGAWVSSRALELAGVDRATPDPVDGRIERDANGDPAGTLQEGAMSLVQGIVPAPTAEEWERAVLAAQAHLHSLGITAWQDAWVLPETLAAYRALAERGGLTARVVAAMWWERDRGEEQIEGLLEARRTGSVGRLRATSVKIMQDGVCENFTAAMLEPYVSKDTSGISFVEPDALCRAVTHLDAEGFQVHVHAIGDRAVREALDAFEAARGANGPNDHRHHIAHLQVVHPSDIPRFAALGVTANCQPYWACLDAYQRDLTIPFLGPERVSWEYPFASLRRAGARLAFGSDWTVSTANPLEEMEVAVNRVLPEERDTAEVFLPDERLDLDAALEAFTAGSAFVNRLDGSIEVGMVADLAVLDRDLFDGGPIADARVVMTLVEGEVVYEWR